MIDLLVRAACDSGDSSDSDVASQATTPPVKPSPRARAVSASPRNAKRRGESLSLATLASSRHRSSFAHRFFRDLVKGSVDPYSEESCPHHVSILRDDRHSIARTSSSGTAASWRPKHQLPNGWYLVDPPDDKGLRQQVLDSLGECSWSGQSGREKRDEQMKSLLVRDIGVVTSATQKGYAKRAKIYTFDPQGPGVTSTEERYRGVKLLCVHDKRRYTRKAGDSPVSRAQGLSGSVRTPPRQTSQTSKLAPRRPTDMQLMSETTSAIELGRMLTSLAYHARDNSMSAERGHKRQRSSIIPDSVVRPDRTHALLNLGATASTHAAQLTI